MENSTDQRGIVPAFTASRLHDNSPPAVPTFPRHAGDDASVASASHGGRVRRALEHVVDVDLLFMILIIGVPLLAYCILMAG